MQIFNKKTSISNVIKLLYDSSEIEDIKSKMAIGGKGLEQTD